MGQPIPPLQQLWVEPQRRCEYCGRYSDELRAHQCLGCGAWFKPAKARIEVTHLGSVGCEYLDGL